MIKYNWKMSSHLSPGTKLSGISTSNASSSQARNDAAIDEAIADKTLNSIRRLKPLRTVTSMVVVVTITELLMPKPLLI